ncbi:MAG TPA: cation transporter, partial [Pasteurellaceae bacterium]|nr:cation transporter [Pasteurellaceae bacterium]
MTAHQHHHTHIDKRILIWSLAIITGFMLVEYAGGYLFNSLALMADAGHMMNDAFSLGLALLALSLAVQYPNLSKWFALINGASLLVISNLIIIEAITRIQNPVEMQPLPMAGVAAIGLLVNIVV